LGDLTQDVEATCCAAAAVDFIDLRLVERSPPAVRHLTQAAFQVSSSNETDAGLARRRELGLQEHRALAAPTLEFDATFDHARQ
jgi:hypothetical protein